MFKRKTDRNFLPPDSVVPKDDASLSSFKERTSLFAKTLSAASLYQPEKPPLPPEQPDMIIGEGVSVSGEVCFDRTLRIDGEFKGELLSEGKLLVGPHGRVNCHINLSAAVIEGQVTGNITVTGSLELIGNAKVYGDISASSLSVAPGVTLIGQVSVKQEPRGFTEADYILPNPAHEGKA